jgi:hypothetical protein
MIIEIPNSEFLAAILRFRPLCRLNTEDIDALKVEITCTSAMESILMANREAFASDYQVALDTLLTPFARHAQEMGERAAGGGSRAESALLDLLADVVLGTAYLMAIDLENPRTLRPKVDLVQATDSEREALAREMCQHAETYIQVMVEFAHREGREAEIEALDASLERERLLLVEIEETAGEPLRAVLQLFRYLVTQALSLVREAPNRFRGR